MALTNQKKQTKIKASAPRSLNDVVLFLREEVKQAGKLAASSQREYERRASQLRAGWDMGPAGKQERYLMRAAGVWDLRRQIKQKLNEADKAHRSGGATIEEREKARAKVLAKATKLMLALEKFRDLPWADFDKGARKEASHKKRAATDSQLVKFFEAAGQSEFRQAFLVAEFTGCRGEELGKGVRVEASKKGGVPSLHFFIESAKCDGDKKGLELREVVSEFPSKASREVKERWLELARSVVSQGSKELMVKVEPTAKMTAGERFTQITRYYATKAEVKMSAYSLRHRVSSQVKAAGDAENTAAVLGHQSTETQRHYGRARSSGGVSPAAIRGVNHSTATIRGAKVRSGPPSHVSQKAALGKMLAAAPPSKPRPRL